MSELAEDLNPLADDDALPATGRSLAVCAERLQLHNLDRVARWLETRSVDATRTPSLAFLSHPKFDATS